MSALVYISKDLSSMRRRAKSSCGRCSSGRGGERQPSPGRATYLPSAKGRNLSLEIDGRQSRTSRRSTSTGRDVDRGGQSSTSRKAAYCFVVPYANGTPTTTVTSPTTYKDDYRSPFGQAMMNSNRKDRTVSPMSSSRSMNFRSSPSPSLHLPSSFSSNSFHSPMSTSISATPHTPNQQHQHHHRQQQHQHHSRSAMTRSATVDNTFGSTKTTYMDHFSWNGHS